MPKTLVGFSFPQLDVKVIFPPRAEAAVRRFINLMPQYSYFKRKVSSLMYAVE